MTDEENIKDLLDDDDIRNFFQSRDPNRKKPDPFLTTESADRYKGKASALTPKENIDDEIEIHGISFTQHVKNIKETARHYLWLGISIGLVLAIVITLLI